MTADYPPIPYGDANFRRVRRTGSLYVDKTRFLRPLEGARFAVRGLLEDYRARGAVDKRPLTGGSCVGYGSRHLTRGVTAGTAESPYER